jgi:chromosome segregation ATPase
MSEIQELEEKLAQVTVNRDALARELPTARANLQKVRNGLITGKASIEELTMAQARVTAIEETGPIFNSQVEALTLDLGNKREEIRQSELNARYANAIGDARTNLAALDEATRKAWEILGPLYEAAVKSEGEIWECGTDCGKIEIGARYLPNHLPFFDPVSGPYHALKALDECFKRYPSPNENMPAD